MNKRTRQLLAENNAFEENLCPENNAVLTDIIVYLRSCPINEYQQECLRRDIGQMLADGEARGEDAQMVLGSDYRAFCEAIIHELPPRSLRAKLFSLLSQFFLYTAVVLSIWLASSLLESLRTHTLNQPLPLTLGSLLSGLLLIAVSVGLVTYICRTAFSTPVQSQPFGFKLRIAVFIFLGFFGFFVLFYLLSTFLTVPILHLPLSQAVMLTIFLFAGHYLVDRHLTE